MLTTQQITVASELLLHLKTILNSKDETLIIKNGKPATIRKILYSSGKLLTREPSSQNTECFKQLSLGKKELCNRLISLSIKSANDVTNCELYDKIKSRISEHYMIKGLSVDIEQAIINCNNNAELFAYLIESKTESSYSNHNLKTTFPKYQINLAKLTSYLELYITNSRQINLIANSIKNIAIDDQFITIAAIANTLDFEFEIDEPILKGVIETLYGVEIADKFYKTKQQMWLQTQEEGIELNKICQDRQEKIKQQKFQNYLELYRPNGLKLANKDTLAIGSQFIDNTSEFFNPHSTIFADLEYADLQGDIFDTIDDLHGNLGLHNKFKLIDFTNVPSVIFENIKKSIILFKKIHDLLKPGGILVIMCGFCCLRYYFAPHTGFINSVLIPAKFSSNQIATFNDRKIYDYNTCLPLLEKQENYIDNLEYCGIIARKI